MFLLWYDKLYDILIKKQFLKELIPHIKTNRILTEIKSAEQVTQQISAISCSVC